MKAIYLLALAGFSSIAAAGVPGDAASPQETLQKAMEVIRATAPALSDGQFVVDKSTGCVYNVMRKAGVLQLEPSVKTPDGKPICKVGPAAQPR